MLLKKPLRVLRNSIFYRTIRFHSLTSVPLEKLLVGDMHGNPSQEWFRRTQDRTRFSMLLSDSPYVTFLRQADTNPQVLRDHKMLQKTPYFDMADLCRRYTGWYFDATTPQQICEWMRRYYRMYKTGASFSEAEPADVRGHSKDGTCPIVNTIADSDVYEVEDGHHRLAIMLANGCDHAQVIVRGKKRTFLQEQLLRVNQTKGTELYQPVPLPEVQTWFLIRKCADRLAMILRFLDERGLRSGHTVLDCACSYGWFVRQFKERGFRVVGLDRDKRAIDLGELIYQLEETDFRHDRLEKFLFASENKFDIVLCLSILHHYALGKEPCSPREIVQRLSRITAKVLFVDTGQSHERWFQRVLPEWNTDFIRDFLLKNGNFKEVISLGADSDNTGKFKDDYGRTLFACLNGQQ